MAEILHRIGIRSSPDDVYRALATRDGLAAWWTNDTEGESKVGGALQFRFADSHGDAMGSFAMRVLDLQPERRVQWQVVDGPDEWVGTRISFDLRQEDDHVIVLFRHQDWREPVEFMYHCSTKWATFLMLSLKPLLETGRGTPNPDDVKLDNTDY